MAIHRTNAPTHTGHSAGCVRFCAMIYLWHVTTRWRSHRTFMDMMKSYLEKHYYSWLSTAERWPKDFASISHVFHVHFASCWRYTFIAHHHKSSRMLQRVGKMLHSSIASNIFYGITEYWYSIDKIFEHAKERFFFQLRIKKRYNLLAIRNKYSCKISYGLKRTIKSIRRFLKL